MSHVMESASASGDFHAQPAVREAEHREQARHSVSEVREPAASMMRSSDSVPGDWQEPQENILRGIFDRILQILARMMPGAKSIRVALHRARGVKIGKDVWIGYDVVLDTARPDLIVIEEGVAISMRAVVIAHFKEQRGVRIEKEAFIGPGVIVLPGVIIGRGAVVKAGSVVSHSVPPMTVVQGNPALPVAKCGIPFRQDVSMRLFSRHLKPLAAPSSNPGRRPGSGGNPAGENTSTGKKV